MFPGILDKTKNAPHASLAQRQRQLSLKKWVKGSSPLRRTGRRSYLLPSKILIRLGNDMSDNKEYMKKYMANRYHTRRAFFINELGGECVDCGTVDNLEFDHVDCRSKDFNIAKRLCSAPMDILAREIAKCVLRCHNCHIVKSVAIDNSVPHGGGRSGKNRCTCLPCREKRNEYNKLYRRKVRSGQSGRMGKASKSSRSK